MTALVTENLSLISGAPNGIAKLRELVLELALRGRLVSQDASDESACLLLDQIAAEKRLLVKQAKPIRSVPAAEQRHASPHGWSWARLGSLVLESGAGWSPSCEPRQREGDEWGVLKVSAVSWGAYRPEENKALPAHLYPRPEHEVQPGDFLVSRANTADLVARSVVVESTPPRLMLSDKIVRLKLSQSCNRRFVNLANSCPDARRYYGAIAGGTSSSMKNVSREQILNLPVPVPPLAEQHRIVAKVDELMALCDRLEAEQADAEAAHAKLVEALLASLTQARDAADFRASWQQLAEHFHTLFTTESSVDALKQTVLTLALKGLLTHQDADGQSGADLVAEVNQKRMAQAASGRLRSVDAAEPADRAEVPYPFPASWGLARICELCEPITSGTTPASSEMDSEAGVPFLKVYNIRNQRIDFSYKPQFVNPEYHTQKMGRSSLKPLDVVMNIVGPPLGKVAIIPEDYPAWNCNQAIVFFRAIPPISHRYLYRFLCEGSFLKGIELIGTAGQDNISVTKSRNIPVPVPPVLEQHRIVAKVDELLDICDQLKLNIAKARQRHEHLASVLVEQAVS
jgi:type I restriction enzyme S subunit